MSLEAAPGAGAASARGAPPCRREEHHGGEDSWLCFQRSWMLLYGEKTPDVTHVFINIAIDYKPINLFFLKPLSLTYRFYLLISRVIFVLK